MLPYIKIYVIIYTSGNRYWTNRGRINGPQHSKIFGKTKMITSKRRKILKFFKFASQPHKNTSCTTLVPRVEHTWECPCCGRIVPRLGEGHDPTSISSLVLLLDEWYSRLLTWYLNFTFWFALVLICLWIFLENIAQAGYMEIDAEEHQVCDG